MILISIGSAAVFLLSHLVVIVRLLILNFAFLLLIEVSKIRSLFGLLSSFFKLGGTLFFLVVLPALIFIEVFNILKIIKFIYIVQIVDIIQIIEVIRIIQIIGIILIIWVLLVVRIEVVHPLQLIEMTQTIETIDLVELVEIVLLVFFLIFKDGLVVELFLFFNILIRLLIVMGLGHVCSLLVWMILHFWARSLAVAFSLDVFILLHYRLV